MYRCARQSRTLWSVIEALQRQRSPRSIKRVTRPRPRESRWRGLRHHRQVLARARAVTGMLRNRALRGSLPARMLLPASWLLLEPPIRSRGLLEACCSAHLNGTRCGAPPCTLALPACKALGKRLPCTANGHSAFDTLFAANMMRTGRKMIRHPVSATFIQGFQI